MKYLFAVITTLLLASHANADDSARVKQLEATVRELTIQNAKLTEQNRSLKLAKGADTEQLPEAGKAAEQERVAQRRREDKLRQENLARLKALSVHDKRRETSGRAPLDRRLRRRKWSRPSSPTLIFDRASQRKSSGRGRGNLFANRRDSRAQAEAIQWGKGVG